MKGSVRVIAGTHQAGGATCLFPVVMELRKRPGCEVLLLGCEQAAVVFRSRNIQFTELDASPQAPLSDKIVHQVLESFQPHLIMTGVLGSIQEGLDYRLIRAARRKQIPTYGILDSWMNYASRFKDPETDDRQAYLPDRLAVMDEQTASELEAEGISCDRLQVTGHPYLQIVSEVAGKSFDRSKRRQEFGILPGERMILFISEPLRWCWQNGLIEFSGYDEADTFEVMLQALALWSGQNVLIVKDHPRHASVISQATLGNRVRLVRSDDPDTLGLLLTADVVVGMSSTLLVYAYLAGLSVVVVQPNLVLGRDRNVLTRRGILPNLQRASQVAAAIERAQPSESQELQSVRREFRWDAKPATSAAEAAMELLTNPAAGSPACSFSEKG